MQVPPTHSGRVGCGMVTGAGRLLFGCIPWGRARSARFANALFFFAYCLLMFIAKYPVLPASLAPAFLTRRL